MVARGRAFLAAVTVVTCVVSAGVAVPEAEAAPAAPVPKPSPGTAVSGVTSTKYRFAAPPDGAKTPYRPTATRWPSARAATVGLLDDARKPVGKVNAAGAPVWARAVTSAAPAQVELQVLDQQAAQRAGVTGVLVRVTPKSTGSGKVRVGVDYATFAQAYGGNYGSRLRLVQMPACALTTPAVEACRKATPLASNNDLKAQAVSAEVKFGSGSFRTSGFSGSAPETHDALFRDGDTVTTKLAADSGAVVLAATAAASTSAAGGTYAATDLKPSGSWSGGGNSGSFTYSYPITVPPAPGGLTPSVSLSYDSGSVDGQTVATQAQASWAGDGWNTPRAFIEQSFTSCADQPEGEDAPKKTADLCYDGPVLTMSLNGATSALVYDKDKKVWKAESDKGDVITHDVDTSVSNDNGSWTVTARDGTVYHFGLNKLPGWASGKATTNSVDTVPVYSAHSGDPCYSSSGWDSSVCDMAWRWNLDYVTDSHGDAMSYYYTQNVNYYGRNLGATDDSYVRDSHLARIDYGFRAGGAYGTVPNNVVFGAADRCVSGTCQPLNATNKANWPDVPYDLICGAGADCESTTPSFFSTVRLASITTQQYSTSAAKYLPVDTYALTHGMPGTGDGTSPTLWLSEITHTGNDTTGGGSTSSIALPSVSFAGWRLPNRVNQTDGLPAFYRYRIQSITTETGSVITVGYALPQACAKSAPAANADSCYPVYWTPDGYTEPTLDWFNKYAVTRVTQTDPTGGAPATATSYAYLGGVAWHYDDNETVKKKYRTYGQFRGYAKVQTFTGDGANDKRTKAETTYYRGMSKNNNATVVNVTDSLGGVHEDLDELAGSELESTVYQGEGGAVDHSTITAYWVSAATATRTRTGLDALTANWVATATVLTRQRVISSDGTTSSWQYNEADNTYDDDIGSATVGVLKTSYTHTVPAKAEYDRCTTNTFAPTSKTSALVGLVSQTETVSVACGGFTEGSPASEPAKLNSLTAPSSVSRPDQVVSQTRTFYDDENFSTTFPQTVAPAKGNVTMQQTANGYSNGAYTYTTTRRATYDDYGRAKNVYDGNGYLTKTEYTMNSVGLTVGTKVTAPLGHVTSATMSPVRGLTLTTTDINNVVSTSQYDALGRITSVWLNNRAISAPANYKYSYTVSKTGISATVTQAANESNGYIKTVTLYDALLRVRQTQSDTPQSGRLVTDTFYDTRGWALYSYNGWWDSGSVPTVGAPVTAADLKAQVPNQTFTTYDGLGRAVVVQSAKNNVTVSTTTTVYQGNRTTVIPPDGGTVTSTLTDPLGRTASLTEYKVRPGIIAPSNTLTGVYGLDNPVSTSGNVSTTTAYGYDAQGNQNKVTDAAGNTWISTYNLLGQVKTKSDPDAGTTTGMAYDGNGNLLESTDSRGKTISTTYDQLNRATGTYAAATAAQAQSNQLTAMVYDNANGAVANMPYPLGHLTTATSYAGGLAYSTQYRGFTVFGGSTAVTTTIPGTGGLAGTYTVGHSYSVNKGLKVKDTYLAKGTLPAEVVAYGYDSFDTVAGFGGAAGYLQEVLQDAYGRITQQAIGSGKNQAYVTNSWDDHTGLLTQQLVTRQATTPANVDQQNYKYDLTGNLIKQTSQRLSAGTGETQCYNYDELRRLTAAWTATDDCAATPTTASHAMVGNTIGSGSAYWTSWNFDDLGNRTSQIQHAITGTTDTTTSYTYTTADHAHALTGTATSGASTGTTSYQYDPAGNTKSRTTATGTQTLDWDDAGKLASVTTTSGTSTNIYGPDGALLLEKTPSSSTLYLGSQQFTLNNSTGAVTGTRYYPLPGGGTVVRTGTGTNYTFTLADLHGTPTLYLDSTAQTPSWRQYTAYGEDRGASIAIPDNRTFLNKTLNPATGLIQMGARQYDAGIGRFISVDPIQDLTDPQQWNGYAYAGNNPVALSDPSGLIAGRDGPAGDRRYADNDGDGVGDGFEGGSTSNSGGGTSTSASGCDERTTWCGTGAGSTGGSTKKSDDGGGFWSGVREWASNHPTIAGFVGGTVIDWVCLGLSREAGPLGSFACGALSGGASSYIHDMAEGGHSDSEMLNNSAQSAALGGLLGMYPGVSGASSAGRSLLSEESGQAGRSLLGRSCLTNSFVPSTPVLLADGSTKPISEVEVGDEVVATDPQSGKTATETVTALHINDDTDLADVTIETPDRHVATLHTTQHHPFWSPERHQWVDAADLEPGETLTTTAPITPPTTKAVRTFNGYQPMYNLTVANIHTYYVLAGNTPVLVHNTTCRVLPSTHTDEFIVLGRREDINAARDWDNHEVLSLPTGTWTPQKNDQWIAGAIAKRQKVYLATSPTRENLYNGGPYNAGMTVFGREIRQLKNAGYTIEGDYMYPPAR